LTALDAVLGDIEHEGVEQTVFLGDAVGYGPDPNECIDRLMGIDGLIWVPGNHDHAVAVKLPNTFNAVPEMIIYWTKHQLAEEPGKEQARIKFLGEEKTSRIHDDYYLVHGSPRNELNEYVEPKDFGSQLPDKLQECLDFIVSLECHTCIVGHSHKQFLIEDSPTLVVPTQWPYSYEHIDKGAILFNCGAVGQQRDGDPRAGYAVVDESTITFHRVEYDVEAEARKIGESGLDEWVGNHHPDLLEDAKKFFKAYSSYKKGQVPDHIKAGMEGRIQDYLIGRLRTGT
ncbi:MAG: metallophosphoesterase family protein, partial [Nanoarchaeota archaeon]|nr:metallophosphoesterase family protein [Nanoarchaeota archaeon]MBU1946752.1 metallophosphoesterase family protein [Nanoarchaeota archaeon]